MNKVFWLILPVWLVLALELVGGWHYPSGHAISLGKLRDSVIAVALAAVVISPMLVGIGFAVVRRHRYEYRATKPPGSTWMLLLTISFLASMFSCYWSCGGHPTWASGYK